MASFEAAVALEADVVELDARLTADRVPVVVHDETVDRTTDGAGEVADLALADIEALDAGSWFGPTFAGQRVPTLETALAYLGPRVPVTIELKPEGFEDPAPADALEVQVVDLLRRLGIEDSVVVASFEHRFLSRLARLAPRVPRGLLYYKDLDTRGAVEACSRYGALLCHPCQALIQAEDVALLQQNDLRVIPWTANDEPTMRRLLDWGVSGLVTNEVELLQRVLEERA